MAELIAEDIVRALAKLRAPIDSEYSICRLCDTDLVDAWVKETDLEKEPDQDPANHKPDCPWRQAREWVNTHG